MIVQGSAALANAGGLVLAVEGFGMGEFAAEVVVVIPLVLVTYLINRNWTFRAR